MPRLESLTIRGYRSIRDELSIRFPDGAPLVLVGENNAGKSNIARALDLILGEWYPGTREPDDHEFWDRNSGAGEIEIATRVDRISTQDKRGNPVEIEGFRWTYNPRAMGEKCTFRALTRSGESYVSNEMRDQCVCVVVSADRRLSYQLSYASKSTLLSKLMRKFHAHLTQDQNRVDRLKQKFEELKAIFAEVAEFTGFQSELLQQFGQMFAGMSYGLQVDFSAYDPRNFFHSLRVLPTEGKKLRTFEELGTGQEQLLALAFAHAYAKAFHGGIILAIEEPEAHLHPLAQQWLARRIRKMAKDGLQIVLTTHSPAFVNLLTLEGVALVRKDAGATTVKQLKAEDLANYCLQHGADAKRTTSGTVLPFYASHATQEVTSGLFAKKVVLVEGQTEALTMPIYLARAGLDVTKEGIAIIPVMGKGNLGKWWRFFTAYEIPAYVTFDNDTKEEDKNGARRGDALGALGVAANDVTRILTTKDWEITDTYCVFGQDFETCMRSSFPDYQQLETDAAATIGESKPLIARHVAIRLSYDVSIEGWKKFKAFADTLRGLGEKPKDDIPF